MRGRSRWFEVDDQRHKFRCDNGRPFERLMDAAFTANIPIWLLCQAATILADRRGCHLYEAWDRLAFNLEAAARRIA